MSSIDKNPPSSWNHSLVISACGYSTGVLVGSAFCPGVSWGMRLVPGVLPLNWLIAPVSPAQKMTTALFLSFLALGVVAQVAVNHRLAKGGHAVAGLANLQASFSVAHLCCLKMLQNRESYVLSIGKKIAACVQSVMTDASASETQPLIDQMKRETQKAQDLANTTAEKVYDFLDFIQKDQELREALASCQQKPDWETLPLPEQDRSPPVQNADVEAWRVQKQRVNYWNETLVCIKEFLNRNPEFEQLAASKVPSNQPHLIDVLPS